MRDNYCNNCNRVLSNLEYIRQERDALKLDLEQALIREKMEHECVLEFKAEVEAWKKAEAEAAFAHHKTQAERDALRTQKELLLSLSEELKARCEKLTEVRAERDSYKAALEKSMRALAIHHKERKNNPDVYTAVYEIVREALTLDKKSHG